MSISEFNISLSDLYQSIAKNSDDYIVIAELSQEKYLFSDKLHRDFNLPKVAVDELKEAWIERIHPADKKLFKDRLDCLQKEDKRYCECEYRVRNREGEYIWIRSKADLLDKQVDGRSIVISVLVQLNKMNKMDYLTGVWNEHELKRDVDCQLSQSEQENQALLLIGVDDFKHINEIYNRQFGDKVLKNIADLILSVLSEEEKLYRVQGDIFAVFLKKTNQAVVKTLYYRIQMVINQQQKIEDIHYYHTASVGCVLGQEGSLPKDYYAWLRSAEYSLEEAKYRGKDQLCFFEPRIVKEHFRRLELAELLKQDVHNGCHNFELYYQPYVDAQTTHLMGAEALARWKPKNYQSVGPNEFIPLLEETRLIIPFGKWMLVDAIKTCKEWLAVWPDFVMHVNLSYVQFLENDFVPMVRQAISQVELDPTHLVFELTESSIITNKDFLSDVFLQLKAIGIRMAMDDFGTGYSALSILKQSPVDVVKIDRIFVQDILTSDFDQAFIRFIVELCHKVNIRVCLEGVETNQEYQMVKAMGLDMVQGYLFGRPVEKQVFYDNERKN